MKKILVLSLVVCSLLFVAVYPAAAADKTITDEKGDVTGSDLEQELTSSEFIDVDNIDIIEITYTKVGKSVTLTLKVEGEIENRGDINDLANYGFVDIDLASYILSLHTSDESYYITYWNNSCNISYGMSEESEALDTFSVINKDTISVTFDLQSEAETYDYMEFVSSYVKAPDLSDLDYDDPDFDWTSIDTSAFVFEEFADEVIDEGSDDGGTNGGNGNGGQDDSLDSGLILFIALIAIIIIIGVVIVVFIIRR